MTHSIGWNPPIWRKQEYYDCKMAYDWGKICIADRYTKIQKEWKGVFCNLTWSTDFVDKDDRVRFYSVTKIGLFARTEVLFWVVKVYPCLPPKVCHMVQMNSCCFKSGEREELTFGLTWNNRYWVLPPYWHQSTITKTYGLTCCLAIPPEIPKIKKMMNKTFCYASNYF